MKDQKIKYGWYRKYAVLRDVMQKVSDHTGMPLDHVCFFFDDFCLYVKNTLRSVPMRCVQLKPLGYINVPDYNLNRKICKMLQSYRKGEMHIDVFFDRCRVVAEQKIYQEKIKEKTAKRRRKK